MSQYLTENDKNLSDNPLNISANITTINKIACEINSISQIKGSITTSHTIAAILQAPDVVYPDVYDGQYEINPKADTATTLNTSGKTLLNDVVVKKIPYFETSNLSGYTVYIASEVD